MIHSKSHRTPQNSTARKFASALLTAALVLAGAATCDDASESRAVAGGPGDVPSAIISGRALDDGRSAQILVAVPSRHHAYLDAGEHGNLIPISFDWQGLSPEPEQVTGPPGERDDDVQAQVLRGSGTYVFKLQANGENAPDFAGRSLRVRSQICDEDKGICYRPTWTEIKL